MRPYFEKWLRSANRSASQRKSRRKRTSLKSKKSKNSSKKEIEKVKNAGLPAKKINERVQLTVWQRLEYLVDPGTWCPLHTIFNPAKRRRTHNVVDGLGMISGKWAVIVGFDNKVMAGAWIPGQARMSYALPTSPSA